MKSLVPPALVICAALLSGCASGNVRSANSYAAVAPPPIKSYYYDPNAAYGSSNATWTPPVVDRQGTITKPSEPSSQGNRPDYENSRWASGAAGNGKGAPAGTF
jgi:hypothetical protein